MVAKIRGDGASSRSAAGEIHPALPKLRDQLQSRRRYGAPLYRETNRHRSRERVERIRQAAVLATIAKRINGLIRNRRNQELELESGKQENRRRKTSCVPAFLNSNLLVS